MKQRSRVYKSYPDWRRREMRMFGWAIAVGGVAAAAVAVVIWLISRNHGN